MTEFEYTINLAANIAVVVKWTIFAVFHLALLALFLLLSWLYALSPADMLAIATTAYRATHLQGIVQLLGAVGVSLLAGTYGYIRLWSWIFSKLSHRAFFAGIRADDPKIT